MIHGIDTGFIVAAEVAEHARHSAARQALARLFAAGDRVALAPQVLAEFIHVVTDPRRFTQPVSTEDARNLAEQWWTATEVDHAYPDSATTKQFLDWARRQLNTLDDKTPLRSASSRVTPNGRS